MGLATWERNRARQAAERGIQPAPEPQPLAWTARERELEGEVASLRAQLETEKLRTRKLTEKLAAVTAKTPKGGSRGRR